MMTKLLPTTPTTRPPIVAHMVAHYYKLTENWIHTQLKHLNRYQPLVLTWHTANLNDKFSPDYYALMERPFLESLANRIIGRIIGYYPSFRFQIHRYRARLIHAHFGENGYFAIPLAKNMGLPLVTTFYGRDASRTPNEKPEWQQRYLDLFHFGGCFLVEGPHMRQRLVNLGCPPDKIIIQKLGIAVDEFPFMPRTLTNGQPLRILVAGRFTEKKGIVYAVEAFARLVQQNANARLTIIGDASQSKETQATKRQTVQTIEQNGLSNWVELRGMQPYAELKKAYYEHHVFLSPSVHASDGNNEGGAPVTLVEAAATGMPVVSTHHCDIPEVVRDGITGLLASERDSDALAKHLLTLAAKPGQMEKMGIAARRHIKAEYDAQRQGQRLSSIYNELIAGKTN